MSNETGMIDISSKPPMHREALASGRVYLTDDSLQKIRDNENPKGDALENAKLAAIVAVKKTPELVFMCHPIKVNTVKVTFDITDRYIECQVKVAAVDRTGVEIEALAGVMNALLALLDVSKRFEKDTDGQYPFTKITDIKVLKKEKVML